MKRAFVIAVCLSILYAGAVTAYAGCDSLITASLGHSHPDKNAEHHHGAAGVPQHSDSGKIHCPNLFDTFLVGSRVSIDPDSRVGATVGYESVVRLPAGHGIAATRFDLGPPGPIVSAQRARHLLLSVIRI